jgi:hypothetical protein
MACWRYWGFGGDGCKIKPLRAVYGNIDDDKAFWNKQSVWCEGVDVWIRTLEISGKLIQN